MHSEGQMTPHDASHPSSVNYMTTFIHILLKEICGLQHLHVCVQVCMHSICVCAHAHVFANAHIGGDQRWTSDNISQETLNLIFVFF